VALAAPAKYSPIVARHFNHLPVLLRAGLLGLLLLAVVGKPISSTWCETHQLVHTISALSHDHFHRDSVGERQLDADHAKGVHGSLHAGDQGSTYADIAAVVTVPEVRFESMWITVPAETPVPSQPIARLFRPPIA
jgi:hypothetical protein